MGVTAGLFAWFAVLWALWRMVTGDRQPPAAGEQLVTRRSTLITAEWMLHAIPVFWTLLYFLYMGTRWVKSVRYFLPLYPALFVLAGWAIVYLWQRAAVRRGEEGEQGKKGAGASGGWGGGGPGEFRGLRGCDRVPRTPAGRRARHRVRHLPSLTVKQEGDAVASKRVSACPRCQRGTTRPAARGPYDFSPRSAP